MVPSILHRSVVLFRRDQPEYNRQMHYLMNVSENYVMMLIQLESEINIFQFYCGCSEITLKYFRSHAHFICSKGHKTEKEQ